MLSRLFLGPKVLLVHKDVTELSQRTYTVTNKVSRSNTARRDSAIPQVSRTASFLTMLPTYTSASPRIRPFGLSAHCRPHLCSPTTPSFSSIIHSFIFSAHIPVRRYPRKIPVHADAKTRHRILSHCCYLPTLSLSFFLSYMLFYTYELAS